MQRLFQNIARDSIIIKLYIYFLNILNFLYCLSGWQPHSISSTNDNLLEEQVLTTNTAHVGASLHLEVSILSPVSSP